MSIASNSPAYKERANWSLALYFFAAMLNLAISFAIWAAYDARASYLTAAGLGLLTLVVAYRSRLLIKVSSGSLQVGVANLPLEKIREVASCDQRTMLALRTRDADTRAYLALRFWVKRGLQIFLNDAKDPTPYWLVSTKNPERLAKALGF